jgi:putative component of membrane protein insertase Oxa1/YidC/SpoIIIJ protein YidD
MPLSVIDLYQKVLPRTNCKDCGFPTCLAFASMVVSEKLPLAKCPHLSPEVIARCQPELDAQYAAGKWTKRDLASDALVWAKERAASMNLEDLPDRIGGELVEHGQENALKLPYFTGHILIKGTAIVKGNGEALNHWEQVFIYNHLSQGGKVDPTGKWKGLEEFPNTISKIKSMRSHVESPLLERFAGKINDLRAASLDIGGTDMTEQLKSADLAFLFRPLPKLPLLLLFWEEDKKEGIDAIVKVLFDETITEHLDIESMMFLSERLRQLLCEGVK